MLKKLEKVLPRYSWAPMLLMLSVNMFAYSVTGFLEDESRRVVFKTPLDDLIPLVPWTVFPYVLCFAQWAVSWYFIANEGEEFCYRFCRADIVAKSLTAAVFLLFPTALIRPEMTGTGPASRFLAFLWSIDRPVNTIPSIHCLASWLAVRAAFKMKDLARPWKALTVLITAGCFVSVVTTKQHYLPDIPAGILCTEIGIAVSALFPGDRFLWQKSSGKAGA